MNILMISNIPSPYRIDFFNELGKNVNLTVIFEAKTAKGIMFNWDINEIKHFKAIFLKEGDIQENKIDWSILKYIKKNKYDVIIATNYAYFTEMIALLTLKLKRIPYFLEIDGGIVREESKLKKIFKSFLISNATGYFSTSKNTDDYLIYYGGKREVIYRYPFTSLKNEKILKSVIDDNQKLKIKKKLKMKEDRIIISVGQFIYRKGFDILLKACNKLEQDVGVYIIGGDPIDEYLKLKENLNLRNVYFERFKTEDELNEYYKAADLFVLPTREDIWGLVINEAMAHGLPIITTDRCVAGMELIENNCNGFIIPINDENILAEKINLLLKDNKLCKKMAINNIEKSKKYTIEKMATRHMEIFNTLIRGNKYAK